MKFEKLPNKRLILLVACFGLTIMSCSKDETLDNNNEAALSENSLERNEPVPFFEVAKGECIAKEIYRQKPEFDNKYRIIYSTEWGMNNPNNSLKATETDVGYGCLQGLRVKINRHGGVPDGYIPVDLNEGAGGKWIWLKCTFAPTNGGIGFIRTYVTSWWVSNRFVGLDDKLITREGTNIPADLNDGAGGDYIYLRVPNYKVTDAIKQIMVVSGNSSDIDFNGWEKVGKDLNGGAGGKYIYLFYKY